MTLAHHRLVAAALALPMLAGCAIGFGQLGPAGSMGAPRRALGTMAGVGYQATSETMGGQRDSNWMRQFQGQAEIAWNLPGNVIGVGGAWTYVSSNEMNRSSGTPGGPARMRFKGSGFGPTAYLRLGNIGNLEGKLFRLDSRIESTDAYVPAVAKGTRVALPARRVEVDLNLFGPSAGGTTGLKLGWQVTKSDELSVFGEKRRYRSSGPHLFVWKTWD